MALLKKVTALLIVCMLFISAVNVSADDADIISLPPRLGAAVITNSKFNLPLGDAPTVIDALRFNLKSNLSEIVSQGDNSYLRMEKITSNDFHIDTAFTNDLNYLVLQSDFRFEKFGATIDPFILRDNVTNATNADETFATIDKSGVLKLSNGENAYTFGLGKWYNIAIALNLPKRVINVYIDNELVKENLPFKNASFCIPRMVRTWCHGTGKAAFCLDNYRIYEAVEPVLDLSELEGKSISVMSDGEREQALLEGKTAICLGSGVIYTNGKKELADTPKEKDGDYYVSKETAQKLLGNVDAKYGDNVPLKAQAASNGLYVYENAEKYLLIFANKRFIADDALINETATYMKMLMPSADTIKADFTARNEQHPRILATASDWERIRNNIKTDSEFATWHKKVMGQADTKLNTPVEYYHYESQENLLQVARRFKEKMIYWGYAWKVTGDRKYVDRAWEEIKAVCSFPDWSPVHPIDTGEMLFGSAIGYDWMYDALTQEQRKTIEEGTLRLGIEVLRSAYYGQLHIDMKYGALSGGNFVTSDTNFNVVVNGGLTAAAMAYADVYPDECFDAASKAIQSLGYMLPGFEPSGGWKEGPNYWDYATAYLANMVSALDTACGTDYGIMRHPGVNLTPYYAIYLDSPQGLNNFSDTARGVTWNSPQFSCFAKVMNEPSFTYQRYKAITEKNKAPTVFDMIWLDISQKNVKPELPLDNFTPEIEMVSIREDWEKTDAMNFGVHGGKNNVYHGHYDGGTWIFDILGERWALDLGMDHQSYVGYTMENLYRCRAEGHNMLVFNPSKDIDFVKQSYTRLKRFETAPKGAIVVYDNSEGYRNWTTNVTRGFYIGDERRSLTVRDEFSVKSNDTIVYWNMQTPADIEIDGNKAILTINDKKLCVEFATDAEDFEVLALKAEPLPGSIENDYMTKDPGINKLALRAKVSKSAYIEAKLYVPGEPSSKSGMINKPISEWTLPEEDRDLIAKFSADEGVLPTVTNGTAQVIKESSDDDRIRLNIAQGKDRAYADLGVYDPDEGNAISRRTLEFNVYPNDTVTKIQLRARANLPNYEFALSKEIPVSDLKDEEWNRIKFVYNPDGIHSLYVGDTLYENIQSGHFGNTVAYANIRLYVFTEENNGAYIELNNIKVSKDHKEPVAMYDNQGVILADNFDDDECRFSTYNAEFCVKSGAEYSKPINDKVLLMSGNSSDFYLYRTTKAEDCNKVSSISFEVYPDGSWQRLDVSTNGGAYFLRLPSHRLKENEWNQITLYVGGVNKAQRPNTVYLNGKQLENETTDAKITDKVYINTSLLMGNKTTAKHQLRIGVAGNGAKLILDNFYQAQGQLLLPGLVSDTYSVDNMSVNLYRTDVTVGNIMTNIKHSGDAILKNQSGYDITENVSQFIGYTAHLYIYDGQFMSGHYIIRTGHEVPRVINSYTDDFYGITVMNGTYVTETGVNRKSAGDISVKLVADTSNVDEGNTGNVYFQEDLLDREQKSVPASALTFEVLPNDTIDELDICGRASVPNYEITFEKIPVRDLIPNRWNRILFVYSTLGENKVYINGELYSRKDSGHFGNNLSGMGCMRVKAKYTKKNGITPYVYIDEYQDAYTDTIIPEISVLGYSVDTNIIFNCTDTVAQIKSNISAPYQTDCKIKSADGSELTEQDFISDRSSVYIYDGDMIIGHYYIQTSNLLVNTPIIKYTDAGTQNAVAEVTYTKASGNDGYFKVYLAAYNATGCLMGITVKEVATFEGTNTISTDGLSIFDGVKRLKAFVFDNNMKPLCEAPVAKH